MAMLYWYIFFVRTGRENIVEKLLKEYLDPSTFTPFIPLQENIFKTRGIIKKEIKPLFPGYVFVESELPSQEFIKKISTLVYTLTDIVYVLRYSDEEIAVRESEKQMLLHLYNKSHCIEFSSGIIEGDRIYITDGPLKGLESLVKKIYRHKRQAVIEIEFMGDRRLVHVALEIVAKIK